MDFVLFFYFCVVQWMAIFIVLLVWAHTWCLLKADDVNSQAFVPYSSLMMVKWLTGVKK